MYMADRNKKNGAVFAAPPFCSQIPGGICLAHLEPVFQRIILVDDIGGKACNVGRSSDLRDNGVIITGFCFAENNAFKLRTYEAFVDKRFPERSAI